MAKKHHNWYIWPRNALTNEVLARFSLNSTNGFEEDALIEAECQDGIRRNLWRIESYEKAWFLWKSRDDLSFHVFSQYGHGPIRDVTKPLFRKERRRPKPQKSKAKCK